MKEKKLAVYNLVLRLRVIRFFIEPPLCVVFWRKKLCHFAIKWPTIAIHNRPIMAIFWHSLPRYILIYPLKEEFFYFRPLMYLHWTNHILDVNYKCYLYNSPREIFARIAICWSIFAVFGIFQIRHRLWLMGAHTFWALSTLQGMSVPHFGGFVIAVSPLQAFTRLHEDWWSSQNSSFQPTNETNNKTN